MKTQKFSPLSNYPNDTKDELRKVLKNAKYSGKTIRDEKGLIIRERGFYHD